MVPEMPRLPVGIHVVVSVSRCGVVVPSYMGVAIGITGRDECFAPGCGLPNNWWAVAGAGGAPCPPSPDAERAHGAACAAPGDRPANWDGLGPLRQRSGSCTFHVLTACCSDEYLRGSRQRRLQVAALRGA